MANIATGQKLLKETDKKRPRSRVLKLWLNIGKYGFPLSVLITISYYLYAFLRDLSNQSATAANNASKPTSDTNIKPPKPSQKGISGKVWRNTEIAKRDPKQPETGWTPYLSERIDEAIFIAKKALSVASQGATDLPATILDTAVKVGTKTSEHLSWFLRFLAEHVYSFLVSSTIVSIYLHSVYGKDIVPLIVAFWAILLACVMMVHNYVTNYSIFGDWSSWYPWNWFS